MATQPENAMHALAAHATTADLDAAREVELLSSVPWASTGVLQLDSMLRGPRSWSLDGLRVDARGSGGGFRPGDVVELTGNSDAAKTLLAQNIILPYLSAHANASAYWVDTDWRFDVRSAAGVLRSRGLSDEQTHAVLDRVHISFCSTVPKVVRMLDELRQILDAQTPNGGPRARFVIIDAFQSIFTPLQAPLGMGQTAQGYALLVSLVRQLKVSGRGYGISVILINSATRVPPKKPSMRPSLQVSSVHPSSTRLHTSTSTTPAPVDLSTHLIPALHPTLGFLTDLTLGLALAEDVLPASRPHPHRNAHTSAQSRMKGGGDGDDWGWSPQNHRAEVEGKVVHVAQVLRARDQPAGKWCAFAVLEGGVLEGFEIRM